MIKKSKVYTRSGDKGLTSLVGGTRVLKSSERIDLYGDVDELNSYVGLIITMLKKQSIEELGRIEKDSLEEVNAYIKNRLKE